MASPEVLDYRLFKVEQNLDHVEDRISQNNVKLAEHGVRMDGLKSEIAELKTTAADTLTGIQQLKEQRFSNLFSVVVATLTVIGTVIGSHFLIK